MTEACQHKRWRRTACADAHLIRFCCADCRIPFFLPLLWSKPQLRWVKEAFRVARALHKMAGPRGLYHLPCPAKDVPYLLGLLTHARYHVEVPEHAATLLVRGGGKLVGGR